MSVSICQLGIISFPRQRLVTLSYSSSANNKRQSPGNVLENGYINNHVEECKKKTKLRWNSFSLKVYITNIIQSNFPKFSK